MREKKGIFNLITSLAYKLIACAIGLIIPRIFVLSYGSELNGLQSSITQIFAFVALIEAGVGEATIQSLFGPVARKDYDAANGILSATTFYYNRIGIIYFIILLVISVLYPLVVTVTSISYWTVVGYIILAGATTGINFFYQSKIVLIMQAEGEMYYNSTLTMLTYILTSVIKIGLILAGKSIILIQLAFFLINSSFIYVYYLIARKRYYWINFREKPCLEAISQKYSVLVHKISGLVFNGTDIILLTFICDLNVVSIYMMYKLVIGMITSIIASFGDSINYKLGQTFNNNTRELYCNMIDSFNVIYSTLAFALFSITSFLIIPFLRLYTAGMDINYIYPLLPIFFIIIEVLQVGREAMLRTVTVAGHFHKTLYQAITEMIINIVVSISAILFCKHFWGNESCLFGALTGTIVALLYRTFELNRYANKKILKRSAWPTNRVMFINVLIYAVMFYFVRFFYWDRVDSYLSLFGVAIVTSFVVLVVYFLVQAALNRKEIIWVLKAIR